MNRKRDGFKQTQHAASPDSTNECVGNLDTPRITDGGAEMAGDRPSRDADIEVYVDELVGRDPSRVLGYRSTPSHEKSIDGSTHAESDVAGEAMATLIEGLKERVEVTEYPEEYVLALVWLTNDHQIDYVVWDSPELNPDTSDTAEDER